MKLINPGEIHLWLINLDAGPEITDNLMTILSDDERARVGRLRIQRSRDHFIVARGAIRKILGKYLSLAPEKIRFVYGPHGKPGLKNEDPSDLFFNLSHSGTLGLLAINRTYDIGVDIETMRRDRGFLKLADRFFSSRETDDLRSLPEGETADGFYSCWTRKEAYLKAIGTGLATPLNVFDVSLIPGKLPALTGQRLDPSETGRWMIHDLEVPSGYRAAVATAWKSAVIEMHQFTEAC